MEAYLTNGLAVVICTVGYLKAIKTRQQRDLDTIKRAATNEAFMAGVWGRTK